MAFILQVKLDCADEEIAATMVAALTTMTSLQDIHPGVVLYHFCRPEPEARPLYYEFTELYGNDGTFFGHSADPKFIQAYSSVWPTDRITSVTYGYGPLSEKVTMVCDNYLKARYPQDTAGSILVRDKFNRDSSLKDDGPILAVGRIHAKDGKADEILQSITKLSSESNDGVITCFANVPEKETAPNDIDFIELCTNNSHLASHYSSEKGKSLLKSLRDNATEYKTRCYGTLLPETAKAMEEVGIEAVFRQTEAGLGYVLHPNADPAGQ